MENKKSISKLSLLLNVVLIGIVAFSGTGCPDTPCPPCPSCPCSPISSDCNCICTDYSGSEPFHLINGELLRTMATAYQETRNSSADPEDASSVWFALDTLKRFIWEIENRVCKKDCPDSIRLGVRIYYARYPSDYSRSDDLVGVDDRFKLKHTVFMVPTFDEIVADRIDHIDFDIDSTSRCLSKIGLNTATVLALIGGRNHGTLCPPICEGTAFGN